MTLEYEINYSLSRLLHLCADTIVKDIMKNILARRKLDGNPQKKNAPSTVKAKGHDWQLRAKKDTFLKKPTYVININPDGSGGNIFFDYPAPDGGNVGFYVTKKGYDFWGISEKAQTDCRKLLQGWMKGTVIPVVKRSLLKGLKNAR